MDKLSINSLLVPLDGSSLAESVLPSVGFLAKKLNTSVTLIHIIEKDAPEKVHGQQHLRLSKQAEKYLNNIAALEIFKNVKMIYFWILLILTEMSNNFYLFLEVDRKLLSDTLFCDISEGEYVSV